MGAPEEGRSRRWYWAGGGLMALGVVVGIASLVTFLSSLPDLTDLSPAAASGGATIELEEGGWTLYWESPLPSSDDSRVAIPPFDLLIEHEASGAVIPTQDYDGDFTVNDSHAFRTFHAPEDGTYRIRAEGLSGTLSVGRGVGGVAGLVAGLAIGAIGFFGGAGLIAYVAVSRSNARRRGARAAGVPPPPPPPPQHPPPPPPPAPPPASPQA